MALLARTFPLFISLAMALPATASHKEAPEYIPPYYIISSTLDKDLKKTEALFAFIFIREKQDASGRSLPDGPVNGPIRFSYNGTEKTVEPNFKGEYDLKLEPGKYLFQFFYNSNHIEITTDSIEIKPAHKTRMSVRFHSSKIQVKCAKPVIYLYPSITTDVQVQLDTQKELDFTYPAYNKGWNVKAHPDGTLEQEGKTFGYLFWEGPTDLDHQAIDWNEGFVVKAAELTAFFEEKLSQLGLNGREMQDFITYWVPRLQNQPQHYIHFLINEAFNRYAALTVSPQPDRVLRVFMVSSPLEENKELPVKPQVFPAFERSGFTVVEWGGTVSPDIEKNIKSH